MKYSKNLSKSVIEGYEYVRLTNPNHFNKWFITCKKDFSPSSISHFVAGETYRIHDKFYEKGGTVSYEISNSTLMWVKWNDLLEYFEMNEEMKELNADESNISNNKK